MIATLPIATLGLFVSLALGQGQPALTIEGVNGARVSVTLADLLKLPQQTIEAAEHGATHTYEGVPLSTLLAKVDLPAGEKFHKTAASYYLSAEAKDGYRAVFAWAELDPTFMDKTVFVAVKRDGKPLAEDDGPFRLVVPGEKRAARWVRQVTALRLKKTD
jgi:hypothetical protein